MCVGNGGVGRECDKGEGRMGRGKGKKGEREGKKGEREGEGKEAFCLTDAALNNIMKR